MFGSQRAHLVYEQEKSVAVDMPDIGANATNADILSLNTAPAETSVASFSALLAKATDKSEHSSSGADSTGVVSRNIGTKTPKRVAVTSGNGLTKANNFPPSPLPQALPVAPNGIHTRSGLINGAECLKTKGLAVPYPIYETSSKPVSTNIPLSSANDGSRSAPLPIAGSASALALPSSVAYGPTTTIISATTSSAIIAPISANATQLSASEYASPPETLRANDPSGTISADPAKVPGPSVLGKPAHDPASSHAPTYSVKTVSVMTPCQASPTIIDGPSELDGCDVASSDKLIPSSGTGFGGSLGAKLDDFEGSHGRQAAGSTGAVQDVGNPDAGPAAVNANVSLFMATNLPLQQTAPLPPAISKVIANSSPVRQLDHEFTIAPQTHRDSKEIANPGSNTNQAQQPLQPAGTAEHRAVPIDTPIGNSERDTPTGNYERDMPSSSSYKSDHGGKHDGDTSLAALNNLEIKGTQESGATPVTGTPSSCPDAMASQILGASAAKENSVPTHSPTDSPPASDAATAQLSGATATDMDHPEQAPVGGGSLGTVHSARLVTGRDQSELRVEFKAGEFGNVDIKTTMVRSQLTAQISVEHAELRNLLTVELPHLEAKLAEHPLTATNIVLNNHGGASSAGSGQSYQQKAYVPQGANARGAESAEIPSLATLAESQGPSAQLDIHI